MTIIYKEGKGHTNADGLSGWPLDNFKSNPAYETEVASKITIHFMEIDRRNNFRFSQWAPESGTPDSEDTEPEGTETPILGISSCHRGSWKKRAWHSGIKNSLGGLQR
ncbi:hypothetical protein O181_004168 [Austropuccinia psidii MF-1]|uniref:Uncharacterized protein n=1 Tax=Austropuccinia psidii MF-1 TaxID=1389203 RepID=A0A9Q3GE96_9BASI|nr:hypothetical protein [Austropuccinia psidii MF-1]